MIQRLHPCRQLWESLPHHSLLILDRYYGQSHLLVRVRDKLNVKVQRNYADGSAEVEVTLH